MLAFGSSFWHGSHTNIGGMIDEKSIWLIGYLSYEAAVQSLPGSSVLRYFNDTEKESVFQKVEQITKGFKDKTVFEWGPMLDTSDWTDLGLISYGYFTMISSMLLPWWLTWLIWSSMANSSFDQEKAKFINEKYLPELEAATKDIAVSFGNWQRLFGMFNGLLLKIFYAFLFQEYALPLPSLYDNFGLSFSSNFAVYWNMLGDSISGLSPSNQKLTYMLDVYSGEAECRTYSPHALWHELTAYSF